MKRARISFLLSTVAIAMLALSSPAQTNRFVQDRFAIGLWFDPPASEITDARYQEIADAGFTVVHGAFGPKTEADVEKQIELCRKFGLVAIINKSFTNVEHLPDGPACWGYHVFDEPPTGMIPDLTKQIAALRQAHPGKLAYVNLLPDYATAGQLGATNYDEYVRRFARETGVDVLSMDYYPQMTPTVDDRAGYCANLAVMRQYSLELGVPHWNFFNTMPFGPHYDPTEAQLRWQIYTSLAYGSKGVFYFCYWTPGKGAAGGGEFPKGGAIITAEGLRTRHYDQASRINHRLKNLGPTLMKLTSTAVIRLKPGDDPAKLLAGTPLKRLSPGGDYLIGIFKHADGRSAVLINNYDPNYTAWPTVEFSAPLEQVVEVDGTDGREKPVRDDSPEMPGLQLSLDAGEGRLFLVNQ